MQQKAFVLTNKGMNRDLSISKAGESSAYENHNIRILARENDTMLSVTNERGTQEIDLRSATGFLGTLIGWNVLNNHLILFTHEDNPGVASEPDHIYRVDYTNGDFVLVRGGTLDVALYNGDLNFDSAYPIESVVYQETEKIQKIYWVDGRNVLRFMNFMANDFEIARWDNTAFDSNRVADLNVTVTIHKDNSGNTRANGVVQYLLTYYNKHGQESGYVWVSDLVYLSPLDKGGSADGTNNNKVTIDIQCPNANYTNYRVYSIFRSAWNGAVVAYLIQDGSIDGNNIQVIDDGAHLEAEDVGRLLYLGSQGVIASTLTHKDQTLFLGDIKSTGKRNFAVLESAIKTMYDSNSGVANSITFQLSDGTGEICDIPYHSNTSSYDYDSQLKYTSSQILSFKGYEQYRFALVFQKRDGTYTEAYWIGDAINEVYPVVDTAHNAIKRVVAVCTLPSAVISAMEELELSAAQLMIAESTYADRRIKAQGFINPTMFNVWERYNGRLYGEASWISRPKNSEYAWRHFEPVHNSTKSTGEIECNYWTYNAPPTPYYRINGSTDAYIDEFDGEPDIDNLMLIYNIDSRRNGSYYYVTAYVLTAKALSGGSFDDIRKYKFEGSYSGYMVFYDEEQKVKLEYYPIATIQSNMTNSIQDAYNKITEAIKATNGWFENYIVSESKFGDWCAAVDALSGNKNKRFFNPASATEGQIYSDFWAAANDDLPADMTSIGPDDGKRRWRAYTESGVSSDSADYMPSYYKKHLMFVDENLITLNSPELSYEYVSFDKTTGYRLRIVGVAKMTSTVGDYTVDAKPGKLAGENLIDRKFSGISGLISWPIWKEYGLTEDKSDGVLAIPEDHKDRTSDNYLWNATSVIYWLHMWNHSGLITAYNDKDNSDYSWLNSKVFANQRYSYDTIYTSVRSTDLTYDLDSVRIFNYTSSQYTQVNIGGSTVFYDANVRQSLMVPGSHKYPILYSDTDAIDTDVLISEDAFLYLDTPISLDFYSSPHAVISLRTIDALATSGTYTQTILPYISGIDTASVVESDAICPWWGGKYTSYTSGRYILSQSAFNFQPDTTHGASTLSNGDSYLLIGEVYDPNATFGSISNTRFITAGPQYTLTDLQSSSVMYANQGDTYFQRWDCLKTKPADATDVTNSVIDIVSVLLETHINIDGRTDNQRNTGYSASIDTSKYGTLNSVYTQQNNFFAQRDLDSDFNLDVYRSAITWTLDKADSAQIDEWTHITLANSLKLDGDKGICRALRRFQNSIIAFQDRGIAEILFNSRTQLTTTDGVPVEIANSGKVDGKRYITNKYGCMNKWSIVEGKNGLYFIDNINKAFCAFTGQGIDPLSTRLGFDVWFRNAHRWDVWTPKKFENIVSYYDRIHSDVYLVTNEANGSSCLVYNENIGAFTSFFDYRGVPMMTNVEDRFVAFSGSKLWSMNTGLYCNFFGEQYDFWTWYRVTPDPYGDKIWSNIDYRADAYYILDENGNVNVPEQFIINADRFFFTSDLYKENDTFTSYRMWNEYQTTGDVPITVNNSYSDVARKKFRIWRIAVARALKHDTNQYGLDRIRNPWVNLMMKKHVTDNRELMQLHDIVVKYFE